MSTEEQVIGVTEPAAEPGAPPEVTILQEGPGDPSLVAEPVPPEPLTREQPVSGCPKRRSLLRRAFVARTAAVLVILVAGALMVGLIEKSGGLSRAQSALARQQSKLSAASATERSLRGQVTDLERKIDNVEKSVGKCQGAIKLDEQFRKAVDDMVAAFEAKNPAAAEAAARRAGSIYDRMNAANSICLDQPGPGASTI